MVFWERAVGFGERAISVASLPPSVPQRSLLSAFDVLQAYRREGWRFFTFGRDAPRKKMVDLSAVDQMMNVFILVIHQ